MRSSYAVLAAARAWRVRLASSSTQPPSLWLAELRRYTLHPSAVSTFLSATCHPASLALRRRLPFIGMWTTEAGGGGGTSLQTITHLYLYPTPEARTAARAAVAAEPGWGAYLAASRPAVQHQAADLFSVPASQAVALVEAAARWPETARRGGGVAAAAPTPTPTPPPPPGGLFELITGGSPGVRYGAPSTAALLLEGRLLAGEGLGSRLLLWRHASLEACLGPRLDGKWLSFGGSGESQAVGAGLPSSRALLRPVAWSPLQ
jgi:hypothetical protein